jgi:hypothetical protein
MQATGSGMTNAERGRQQIIRGIVGNIIGGPLTPA